MLIYEFLRFNPLAELTQLVFFSKKNLENQKNIKKTNMTSEQFCDYILKDANVAILPGTSFGRFGEGYVRMCYAVKQERINDAIKRIRNSINKLKL